MWAKMSPVTTTRKRRSGIEAGSPRRGALAAAGLFVLFAVLRSAPIAQGHGLDHGPDPGPHELTAAARIALQDAAFAEAEAQPGFQPPHALKVRQSQGQGVEAALEAAGAAPGEARAAVSAISEEVDTVNTPAGRQIELALAAPRSGAGPARLIGLSMESGADGTLVLSRSADGAWRLLQMQAEPAEHVSAPLAAPAETPPEDPPVVIQGVVQGSLYLSLAQSGASLQDAAQALRLLSHKLDLSRDVDTGDGFRLVFDRSVTGGGLRYLEVAARGGETRLYGLPAGGGKMIYVDDQGRPLQGGLLRTPVDAARITSGFGFRMHPILGYSRMHQGIDFGAPAGSAVFAAGDGVVEEARWNGGYGRWLKIRHAGGWETGYAHLSAFAPAAAPGAFVRQGQLVGYVGASGLATGPHLHYEVIRDGEKIDPRTANPQGASALAPSQTAEFLVLKARLAALSSRDAARG